MAAPARVLTRPADPLHRLAELYGIATGYVDAFGQQSEVPRETLRALLTAMGAGPLGERQMAALLSEVEHQQSARLLEPVVVKTASEAVRVSIWPPAGGQHQRLDWRVESEDGQVHEGAVDVDRLEPAAAVDPRRRSLNLRRRLPVGEHRLRVALRGGGETQRAESSLIVTPQRCFSVEDLAQQRLFGIGAQLYSLRSGRDFGIGDFDDLGRFAEIAARAGASLVGVNPLHALFPAEPRHISPYSPSNRSFLNPLYLALDGVPEFAESAAAQDLVGDASFQARLDAVRASALVEHQEVAALKYQVLEALFRTFRERHLRPGAETGRGHAFRAFARAGGAALFRQACFDVLHETMLKERGIWSWRDWPEGLRSPDGSDVTAFAAANGERIVFFQYLQWLADEQLGQVQARARAAGMGIGLYRDLAVAVSPDGATAWANPGVTVTGASVGAPPDLFNTKGQNWGLAPLSPVGLQTVHYRPLRDDIRQNLRHAGAIRIDHVMGLMRLFWIPDGARPVDGAYVRYPLEDLTRLIALESRRERCLVIGEDLGTVAEGFRETMHKAGILSYRLLWFERTRTGGIQPPQRYPRRALISVSTHDLPTLRGFFEGRDLDWRDRLDLYVDQAAATAARGERGRDLRRVLKALERAGLLAADVDPATPEGAEKLKVAVHAWLAATPSQIMMVQIEDLLGEEEQANLPGTIDQHPNWRRKLSVALDELACSPALDQIGAIMQVAGRSTTR